MGRIDRERDRAGIPAGEMTEYGWNDPHIQQEHEKIRKRFSKIVFSRTEVENFHNSYENERKLLECIRNGDMEGLKACWNETSNPKARPESYGKLAAADNMRDVKNLCIVAVTLASRASIEGGTAPELAFSLCDSYIQRLEEIDSSWYLMGIVWYAELDFTDLVIKAQERTNGNSEGANYYVTRCKDYIMAHLHGKITVAEIADHLHVNANYLSGLFSKAEGCTILSYIQKNKIELVKNLLTWSDYSYDQIAAYLGYSSQSNMNAHFKKLTGMTLSEYRKSRYSARYEFTTK